MSDTATSTERHLTIDRGMVVTVAVTAIVLGLTALFLPKTALLTIAIIFGINLLILGAYRIVQALTSTDRSSGSRWATGILGVLVLGAGIICLVDPFRSLQALGFIIGIGWIFDGTSGILGSIVGYTDNNRWTTALLGVVTIAAGITVMILPLLALATFVTTAGIILIILGVATLTALPRRPKHRTAAVYDARFSTQKTGRR